MPDLVHPSVAGDSRLTTPEPTDLEQVAAYHRSSSLDPGKPAPMPEGLDWPSRPNPFRRYRGAHRLRLPLAGEPQTVGAQRPSEITVEVGRILEDSLGLGGWKRWKNARFGLRRAPSAGNLHPTEAYVLLADSTTAEQGASLHHYSPFDHALELRRRLPDPLWRSLEAACPRAICFIALSSIYWRNAWKYGDRSFRLCHLDAGHGVAALSAAAALSDHRLRWVDVADAELAELLGLGATGDLCSSVDQDPAERREAEDALCLLALEPRRDPRQGPGKNLRWRPKPENLSSLSLAPLEGEPSPISVIGRLPSAVWQMARLTRRRREAPAEPTPADSVSGDWKPSPTWPRQVLHGRRSHSTFEDRAIELSLFQELVACGLDETGSSFPWRGDLAMLLFVHRVEGLESGLYAASGGGSLDSLRGALRAEFEWLETSCGAAGLYCLSAGDARAAANHLAGGQSAAGDGAFTALILARFQAPLEGDGPFAYRRLHWQAGEMGHRLYLQGEARGLGVTGLGGFYDPRLCAALGLRDASWRPIYLLAVGRRLAAEDLALEPAYAHRDLGAEPLPAFDGGYRIEDASDCLKA